MHSPEEQSPEEQSPDPENDSPAQPEAPESNTAAEGKTRRGPSTINIRNFSVRCGRCNEYMVIVGFGHLDEDWNLYTYECETEPCVSDPSITRTYIEVPAALDEFANRDPNWRGGQKWGGA